MQIKLKFTDLIKTDTTGTVNMHVELAEMAPEVLTYCFTCLFSQQYRTTAASVLPSFHRVMAQVQFDA